MVAKKRSKMVTVLLMVFALMLTICSSSVTVFAQSSSLEDYIAEHNQTVVDSGILASDSLFEDLAINTDSAVLDVAKKVVELVGLREAKLSEYSDENAVLIAEPARVKDVKAIRDEAASYRIGTEVLGANALDYLASFEVQLFAKFDEITALLKADEDAWNAKAIQKATSVYGEYEHLLAKNNAGGTEYDTVGCYSSAQRTALKQTLDSLVKQNENEEWVFVNPVVYQAKNVVDCEKELNAQTEDAIILLNAVPRNDLEIAYQKYNDFIAMQDSATDSELQSAITELKRLANKALTFYSRAGEEVKLAYSNEHANLQDFIDYIDSDGGYVPARISTLRDGKRVLTITAKYASGSKKGHLANVIPDNCKLIIYASANSAPKRNVTNAIKDVEEFENKLSVAYHITIKIERGGYKYYTLPSRDSSGNLIEYEVELDLEGYYKKYCEDAGRKEKDKLQNIIDAQAIASAITGSTICYGYDKGVVQAFTNYSLEGGVLMFTTNSHLATLSIAGEGLESLFTNPIFWVIAVVALILIIILIKAIVKHVRYTIKFVTNGGSAVANIRAAKGECFVMPDDPVKAGYVFAGWYTDKALTNRFVGTVMRKRAGFKLYAKWVTPLTSGRIIEMYDELRDAIRAYKKVSFKPLLGLTETELLAVMYYKENYIQLNLALNPDELKKEGIAVVASKEKRFAEVPAQILISTEELFQTALELVKRALTGKGLQLIEDYEVGAPSTEEERKNGFAYTVANERVASTAEDYFEMLRLALKAYVMEEDNGMFKPGDKVTLARIYITNEVACLHLPTIKGEKDLKPSRDARFEDTPVIVKILAPRDMLDAYALIHKVMTANGLVRNNENANDLVDVKVPATNGFAYTLMF